MKPLEARSMLEQVVTLLWAGQPLPPVLRAWIGGALRRRLAQPESSLDALLGLRSRRGGRLHAFSTMPARDRALAALAGAEGSVADRAAALRDRILAHATTADPALAAIELKCGRLPRSLSQLQRIVAGRTTACQMNR